MPCRPAFQAKRPEPHRVPGRNELGGEEMTRGVCPLPAGSMAAETAASDGEAGAAALDDQIGNDFPSLWWCRRWSPCSSNLWRRGTELVRLPLWARAIRPFEVVDNDGLYVALMVGAGGWHSARPIGDISLGPALPAVGEEISLTSPTSQQVENTPRRCHDAGALLSPVLQSKQAVISQAGHILPSWGCTPQIHRTPAGAAPLPTSLFLLQLYLFLQSASAVVGQHTGRGVIHIASLPTAVGHPEASHHLRLAG